MSRDKGDREEERKKHTDNIPYMRRRKKYCLLCSIKKIHLWIYTLHTPSIHIFRIYEWINWAKSVTIHTFFVSFIWHSNNVDDDDDNSNNKIGSTNRISLLLLFAYTLLRIICFFPRFLAILHACVMWIIILLYMLCECYIRFTEFNCYRSCCQHIHTHTHIQKHNPKFSSKLHVNKNVLILDFGYAWLGACVYVFNVHRSWNAPCNLTR